MLTGACWPWNLSTVPTRAAGSSLLIAPTCALYGATIRTSSHVTGQMRPLSSLHVDPPSTIERTSSATASASGGDSLSYPVVACATHRGPVPATSDVLSR